jgi:hypothetical protein
MFKIFKKGKTETKLLYTLHWLILDAAYESEDNTVGINPGKRNGNTSKKAHLHSVATIQLFIYLFIPILKSLKREDLDTLKLSNGLKIWDPLWAYSQPDIKIFTNPVRKNKNVVEKKVLVPEFQEELFLSREVSLKKKEEKPSKMSVKLKHKLSIIADKIIDKKTEVQEVEEAKLCDQDQDSQTTTSEQQNKKTSLPKSFSCAEKLNNNEPDESLKDGYKPEVKNIRSESLVSKSLMLKKSQSDLDRILIAEEEDHSFGISDIDNEVISDSLFSLNEKNNSTMTNIKLNAPLAHMNSICISDKSITRSITPINGKATAQSISKETSFSVDVAKQVDKNSCAICQEKITKGADKCDRCLFNWQKVRDSFTKVSTFDQFDGLNEKLDSIEANEKTVQSILDATYFDIGVMRCLLSPKWNTEGYLWSLEYLSHRVLEITDHILKEQDKLFKFKCPSMPSNLNNLFEMMGVGTGNEFDEDLISIDNQFNCKNSNTYYTNQFIELVNQIYFENDQTNNNYMVKNANDYSKRRKYEASFQTRIR